jgi:hypothetical protein
MTDEVSNFMEAHTMIINISVQYKPATDTRGSYFVITRINDGIKKTVPYRYGSNDIGLNNPYRIGICEAFTGINPDKLQLVGNLQKNTELFAYVLERD